MGGAWCRRLRCDACALKRWWLQENGTIAENVAWRCAEAFVKGDRHTVRANTMFAAHNFNPAPALAAAAAAPDPTNLGVMQYNPAVKWSKRGENAHTLFFDNLADCLLNVSGRLAGDNPHNNIAGPVLDTQRAGGAAAQLVDPGTMDFRPKPASQVSTVAGTAGSGAAAHS